MWDAALLVIASSSSILHPLLFLTLTMELSFLQ